jgi:uncharacterized protein
MQALYEGKTDEAQAIAEARADLDVFEAAAIGDVERLRELLDQDLALVHAWSEDGFTPLHFAAFFGHPEAAKLLAERGADLEARSTNEQFALDAAPLHSAAASGELEVCRVLLDAGADVNAVSQVGRTPLLVAASANGMMEVARLLLARGADVNARDTSGVTPLIAAASVDDGAVASVLLTHGADRTGSDTVDGGGTKRERRPCADAVGSWVGCARGVGRSRSGGEEWTGRVRQHHSATHGCGRWQYGGRQTATGRRRSA